LVVVALVMDEPTGKPECCRLQSDIVRGDAKEIIARL